MTGQDIYESVLRGLRERRAQAVALATETAFDADTCEAIIVACGRRARAVLDEAAASGVSPWVVLRAGRG